MASGYRNKCRDILLCTTVLHHQCSEGLLECLKITPKTLNGIASLTSQGKSIFMSGSGDLPAIVGIIIAIFPVSVKP